MSATYMSAVALKVHPAPLGRRTRLYRAKTSATSQMGGGDAERMMKRRDALSTGLLSSLALQMLSPATETAAAFSPSQMKFEGTWESVCTYNVLRYPSLYYDGISDNDRSDELDYILKSIGKPSLLFFQEIDDKEDLEALQGVLKKVNPSYAVAIQKENFNTTEYLDVITVYDSNVFEYLPMSVSTEVVDGGVNSRRDIIVKKLKHKCSGKEFLTANVHFKAGRDDDRLREEEAKDLIDRLNSLRDTSSFIIAGDTNIYSTQEEAYKLLAGGSGTAGIAVDPLDPENKIFSGRINNPKYAIYHTQATRTTLGGRNYGGLDDRFDMMFVSKDFFEAGIASYSALCNDGRHYNGEIQKNNLSGCDDTGALPKALELMSDHLPVTMMVNFS